MKQNKIAAILIAGMLAFTMTGTAEAASLITPIHAEEIKTGTLVERFEENAIDGEEFIPAKTHTGKVGEAWPDAADDAPDLYHDNEVGYWGHTNSVFVGKRGTFEETTRTLIHYYIPLGRLTVKYTDLDGNKIADGSDGLDERGEAYTTTQKEIDGYEFVEVAGNPTGTYQLENQTVTYKYKKEAVITTKVHEETQKIAFQTIYEDDPTLDAGVEKVKTEGITGERVKTVEITYTDGVQTGRKVLKTITTIQKVDKVILRGTKVPDPVEPEEPVKPDPEEPTEPETPEPEEPVIPEDEDEEKDEEVIIPDKDKEDDKKDPVKEETKAPVKTEAKVPHTGIATGITKYITLGIMSAAALIYLERKRNNR